VVLVVHRQTPVMDHPRNPQTRLAPLDRPQRRSASSPEWRQSSSGNDIRRQGRRTGYGFDQNEGERACSERRDKTLGRLAGQRERTVAVKIPSLSSRAFRECSEASQEVWIWLQVGGRGLWHSTERTSIKPQRSVMLVLEGVLEGLNVSEIYLLRHVFGFTDLGFQHLGNSCI